jgi:ABC-type transporter Mla subunit MlaD
MEATITISQLAQGILFIVLMVVAVYAAFMLKQVNALIRHLHAMLNDNEAQLNRIVVNLSQVTSNSAEVSSQLRDGFNEAAKTIKVIGRETADTVLTLNKTADYVSTYAVIIQEVLKGLIKLFSGQDKK